MKRAVVMAAVLSLIPLTGCVPLLSLHPLWDETTRIAAPALVGTWTSQDGDDTLLIRATGDREYDAVYSTSENSKKETSRYAVHALQLGNYLFLDFAPDNDALDECTKSEAFLPVVTAHFFARAVLNGDGLELGLLDDEAFLRRVRAENIDIRFEELGPDGKDPVLVAATGEIQKFVLKHAEDPDLWEKTSFHRLPEASRIIR